MVSNIHPIQSDLRAIANAEKAKILSGFFKTGPGQYGEWDRFLGIKVPDTRAIVKKHFSDASLNTAEILLSSEYHEERLAGVLLLVEFAKRKKISLENLARFYMDHCDRINNWDLVDLSSGYVLWPYLETMETKEKYRFINECIESPHLWTNRIIVLASFYSIMKGNGEMIFSIAPRFFTHKHDLMHKAVWWMLREAGKRVSEKSLCDFLDSHAKSMPRTMLRYAIERLEEKKRIKYMARPK